MYAETLNITNRMKMQWRNTITDSTQIAPMVIRWQVDSYVKKLGFGQTYSCFVIPLVYAMQTLEFEVFYIMSFMN